jgi:hypothetical protein
MTWDDVLTRMEKSGLEPVEETYMENYGKILSAQRPEFRDRLFRCIYGAVKCAGIDLEVFLFPNEVQRDEFMDVVGTDPWWLAQGNAVVHFPECDPAIVTKILKAIA